MVILKLQFPAMETRDRLGEYVVKGVHLGLRQVAAAPEQRQARRLARQAHRLPASAGRRVLVMSPRDWTSHVQWEAMIGQALRVRGADVRFPLVPGGQDAAW